jgi:hypothetical protein
VVHRTRPYVADARAHGGSFPPRRTVEVTTERLLACGDVRHGVLRRTTRRRRERRAHTLLAVDERSTLTQARSMLILLLAACKQTQTALEATANALDTDLTRDLTAMIERTEHELTALNDKILALSD